MPSKQSEAVRRHWTTARLAMVQPDAEQPDDESWGDLTAEPREVDYIEADAGGLPAMWAVPKRCAEDRVLLCMHGGGFLSGSMYSHRKLFGHLAKAAGTRALIFDYRLAPKHTHPTQVDDATSVYRWLLDQGVGADHIAFTGDSAGGGLSITTQLRAREQGLPPVAAAMPFSPWVDMEVVGESYETNRDREPFFYRESVRQFAGIFLGEGGDPRDPLASPLHADLSGLAPTYIQVGGDETLLDDARRLDEHARRAGVDVRIDVFPDMPHTFQMAAGRAPEADDAIRRMADWVRPRLGLTARGAVMAHLPDVVPEEFTRHTEPFRRELLAHCYRMLGSADEAEDLVQETYLRAWRSYDAFEGRSSLRVWLYRIATNACLTALQHRGRRAIPSSLDALGDDPDVAWLQPIADTLVTPESANPETVVTTRESLRLALVASLQYLPPRQRAVLILREVLAFPAAEVATMLDTTTAAVKSTLQRARARLDEAPTEHDRINEPTEPHARALLDEYITGFEKADLAALERALRTDAAIEMIGTRTWFSGRATCLRFLASVIGSPGDWRMTPTIANGQPAAAAYHDDGDGIHRAFGLGVLTVTDTGIARILVFGGGPDLVATFGLPPTTQRNSPGGADHVPATY